MNGDRQVLTQLFMKLRVRAGLTPDRLRSHCAAEVLTALALSTRGSSGSEDFEAAVDAVAETAEALPDAELLVADAALNLRVLERLAQARSLPPHSAPIPVNLYADTLQVRRRILVNAWDSLVLLLRDLRRDADEAAIEDAAEAELRPVPTVSSLRAAGGDEERAFEALAAILAGEAIVDAPPERPDGTRPSTIEPLLVDGSRVRAVVLGAAVMDVIFVLREEQMPPSDQSRQAIEFSLHPGGKGLVQAVAAHRLGMDTSLVAALGMRPFGQRIEDYLDELGLSREFIAPRPDAHTPVTGVVVLGEADGASMALGWRGEAALEPSTFRDGRYLDLLRQASVLFVTFEPPLKVVEAVLNACKSLGDDRPLVVLTPAPPYDDALLGGRYLDAVDVIVANEWELQRILVRSHARRDPTKTLQELLGCGVEAVCVFDTRGVCTVHLRNEPVIVQTPMHVAQRGTAGARDAFCAALAYQLLDGTLEVTSDKVEFAMAAWSAAIRDVAVPDSMPYLKDIWKIRSVATRTA